MISHIPPKCMPAVDDQPGYSQIVTDDFQAYLAGLVTADFADGRKVLGDVAAESQNKKLSRARKLF